MNEAAKKNDEFSPQAAFGSKGPKKYEDKPGTHGILLEVQDDGTVLIREHLYRTEDHRVVHESDRDGRWKCYPRGAVIPKDEAVRMGLLEDDKPKSKGVKPEENK